MSPEPDVFVIGDVHGHVGRLEALLEKAGVNNRECLVIQLGDLAHVGYNTRDADVEAWYRVAKEHWVDHVLWGNHDRAVIDSHHIFGGYNEPRPELNHLMRLMQADGRLTVAYEAHGWLLTHAGLAGEVKFKAPHGLDLTDATAIAEYLNTTAVHEGSPLINAISRHRGGPDLFGGILWRDIGEQLWSGVPQVFGHSADKDHLVRGEQDKWYCVDIGGKGGRADPDADCLAGLWLPSQEIVRVDLNQGVDHQVLQSAG